MRLPEPIRCLLLARAWQIIASRAPDFVLDGYMDRWHALPRNGLFNIYVHRFRGDDRALHDHPYFNVSAVLDGRYLEETPAGTFLRSQGSVVARTPWAAHRIYLGTSSQAVTLFVTGPRVRVWGFWCPKGWIPYTQFTAKGADGRSAGCP